MCSLKRGNSKQSSDEGVDASTGCFIASPQHKQIRLEKFHLCTWDLGGGKDEMVEFGFQIQRVLLDPTPATDLSKITLKVFIPWMTKADVFDLYSSLKESANIKFIFNKTVISLNPSQGGEAKDWTSFVFSDNEEIVFLKVTSNSFDKNLMSLVLDLPQELQNKKTYYVRVLIKVSAEGVVSQREKGLATKTIVYDIKVNEERNLPDNLPYTGFREDLVRIDSCYFLHIVPAGYKFGIYDSLGFKSIRSLETKKFNKYFETIDFAKKKDIKDGSLFVVFNKKTGIKENEGGSCFTSFTNEIIGMKGVLIGLLINLIAGVVFFILEPVKLALNIWCLVFGIFCVGFLLGILVSKLFRK